MRSDSIELKLRVILVTTRAALRHAKHDADQRRAIVGRGRELVDALGPQSDPDSSAAIQRAHAELVDLERA